MSCSQIFLLHFHVFKLLRKFDTFIFKAVCVVSSTMPCIYMKLWSKSSIWTLPGGFEAHSGGRWLNPCSISVHSNLRRSFGNPSVPELSLLLFLFPRRF